MILVMVVNFLECKKGCKIRYQCDLFIDNKCPYYANSEVRKSKYNQKKPSYYVHHKQLKDYYLNKW